ncbi:MAG: hypothetical protein GQ527_08185 [Bacteroidales bacterium]|nr:hypothetical protein [Bacteroidales bacterium]
MNRGNQIKHKSVYLLIAFAIFSVSFASIINFHIAENHGLNVIGHIEFLKTDKKKSCEKDSSISFQIDLNSGSFLSPIASNRSCFALCSIIPYQVFIHQNIYTGSFLTPVLRGSPF